MRRFLILLFVFALPLQFAYGAAARYCGHEKGANISHFSHHAHVHQTATPDAGADASLIGDDDSDCDYCHLGCAQPLVSIAPSVTVQSQSTVVSFEPRWTRHRVPTVIERPNWSLAV